MMNRTTPTLAESVEMVLDYLWDAEARDFEELETHEQRPPHIFEALVVLSDWLNSQRTPDALKCEEGKG